MRRRMRNADDRPIVSPRRRVVGRIKSLLVRVRELQGLVATDQTADDVLRQLVLIVSDWLEDEEQ